MTISLRSLFVLLLFVSPLARYSYAQSAPVIRPALLGHHQRSLINMIDANALMKRGQKDGLIMFSCGVTPLGFGYWPQVYRGTPDSKLLGEEVSRRIMQAQFEPALYNGTKTGVWIFGTVVFAIGDGKPHVRIFLNQEDEDVTKGRDFIAPQLAFVPGNTKYKGIYYPRSTPGFPGVAAVTMEIDTSGHVKNPRVSYEHPKDMKFGAAAASGLLDAIFIPGFRNGKIVSCRFTMPVIFSGPGFKMTTG
ncbi:MAG: hypothetical protein ABIR71_11960 [Chthoniobacterales bacterium]